MISSDKRHTIRIALLNIHIPTDVLMHKDYFNNNLKNQKIGTKTSILGRLNCARNLKLYKTIIEPHITYFSSILYLSNSSDFARLHRLQNKCMKQIKQRHVAKIYAFKRERNYSILYSMK